MPQVSRSTPFVVGQSKERPMLGGFSTDPYTNKSKMNFRSFGKGNVISNRGTRYQP